MENVLTTIGFLLIILGWSVQLYISAARRIFALSLKFVVIYAVGCILLVIDAFQTRNTLVLILNLAIAILALLAGYFAKKARL
ncbi:MAG: hypothetical protein ACFFCW_15140 [Candidatus Hodarchaeota archaeon]